LSYHDYSALDEKLMMTDITDLKNRLEKNLRVLGKWAQQQGIECYRLYDADLPEFAFAVDLYASAYI